jgi:hypothetical protein
MFPMYGTGMLLILIHGAEIQAWSKRDTEVSTEREGIIPETRAFGKTRKKN